MGSSGPADKSGLGGEEGGLRKEDGGKGEGGVGDDRGDARCWSLLVSTVLHTPPLSLIYSHTL